MQFPDFNVCALVAGTPDSIPIPDGEFWVFGYGSLMWNPGFEYIDSSRATLHGYHRRLCLWSVNYRGTTQQPGLVLGLARGGSCRGYAYQIAERHKQSAVAYLCERELITSAYDARLCRLRLHDGRKVCSLAFVCRTEHPHFVPKLAFEDTVNVVKAARGKRGWNRDYVVNTVHRMNQMNIRNTALHRVAAHLSNN